MKRVILAALAIVLFTSVRSDAVSDAARSYGLDLSANNSLGTAATGHMRVRYNSSTAKGEISIATGAYDGIVTTAVAPRTLVKDATPVASVTSGEIDGQTYTLPANTLTVDGQKVNFDAAFSHAANTNSATWKFYVAGNALFTTARTVSGESESVSVTCVRRSSTVLRCQGVGVSGTAVTAASNGYTVDYTSTIIFKTGIIGATANGDMTSLFLRGEWWP